MRDPDVAMWGTIVGADPCARAVPPHRKLSGGGLAVSDASGGGSVGSENSTTGADDKIVFASVEKKRVTPPVLLQLKVQGGPAASWHHCIPNKNHHRNIIRLGRVTHKPCNLRHDGILNVLR